MPATGETLGLGGSSAISHVRPFLWVAGAVLASLVQASCGHIQHHPAPRGALPAPGDSVKHGRGGPAPPYSLIFIEFDDHGDFWEPEQLEAARRELERLASPEGLGRALRILVYVHGWKHDASDGSEDRRQFEQFLGTFADSPDGDENNPSTSRYVVGVYLGWRGNTLTHRPVARQLTNLTFWNRKAAAKRVGGIPATQTVLRLLRDIKVHDAARASAHLAAAGDAFEHDGAAALSWRLADCDSVLEDKKPPLDSRSTSAPERSQVALIGHSMGALVLESALSQAILGRLLGDPVVSRARADEIERHRLQMLNWRLLQKAFGRCKRLESRTADDALAAAVRDVQLAEKARKRHDEAENEAGEAQRAYERAAEQLDAWVAEQHAAPGGEGMILQVLRRSFDKVDEVGRARIEEFQEMAAVAASVREAPPAGSEPPPTGVEEKDLASVLSELTTQRESILAQLDPGSSFVPTAEVDHLEGVTVALRDYADRVKAYEEEDVGDDWHPLLSEEASAALECGKDLAKAQSNYAYDRSTARVKAARALAEAEQKERRADSLSRDGAHRSQLAKRAQVLSKTAQALKEQTKNLVRFLSEAAMAPPADLVLLFNPASEALFAKQLIEALKQSETANSFGLSDRPLIVSVSSKGDRATRWFFPLGVLPLMPFRALRRYDVDRLPPEQWRYLIQTGPNMPALASHDVYEQPLEKLKAGEQGAHAAATADADRARLFKQNWDAALDPSGVIEVNTADRSYRIMPKHGWNQSGYWMFEVPTTLIADHSDIFDGGFYALVSRLMRASRAFEDRCSLVDGVDPCEEAIQEAASHD